MIYVNDFETGKKAIVDRYPELMNSQFKSDNSGWTNFAIKVDDKYIFRFPRNNEAYQAINKEILILQHLKEALPLNIKVPNYIYSKLDRDYPYVGYEKIEGEFLDKESYDNLSDLDKSKLLDDIVTFLNILHKIDYQKFNLEITNPMEKYKELYNNIKEKCFKYFDEELKTKTVELFETYFNDENMFNYIPTLIHGDLSEDHILIADDGIGIIDFGDVFVFNPDYDFTWAYLLDESFFDDLVEKYKGNKDNNFKYKIKNFHLKIIPYYGVLYADKIKDEDLLKREIEELRNCL